MECTNSLTGLFETWGIMGKTTWLSLTQFVDSFSLLAYRFGMSQTAVRFQCDTVYSVYLFSFLACLKLSKPSVSMIGSSVVIPVLLPFKPCGPICLSLFLLLLVFFFRLLDRRSGRVLQIGNSRYVFCTAFRHILSILRSFFVLLTHAIPFSVRLGLFPCACSTVSGTSPLLWPFIVSLSLFVAFLSLCLSNSLPVRGDGARSQGGQPEASRRRPRDVSICLVWGNVLRLMTLLTTFCEVLINRWVVWVYLPR